MSTVLDPAVVRAAADYLEAGHWSREVGFSDSPSGNPEEGCKVCVHGALWLKSGYDDSYHYTKALRQHLGFTGTFAVWDWNDAPERTADEVVAALRALADSLDAQP